MSNPDTLNARPLETEEHVALDEDYVLTAAFVEKVVDAADDGDGLRLRGLLEDLHPADVADLMGFLTVEHRGVVVLWLPPELLAATLPELDDGIREEVLERVPHLTLAEALQELDSDDAAAVVEDLEDDRRERVLAAMPDLDRAAIESSLGYAEDSAGRLMQREVMAAPQFWSVGDTIDHVRAQGEELPELFFDIYVVDPLNRPVGGVAVSQLLRAPRSAALTDLMEPINEIAVDQDQEEVAYVFEKYHLISAPVIDSAGRLVGQITVDDIVNIIQEENREDILRLAGVSDEDRGSSISEIVRGRVPWLAINLGTAVLGASVISWFGATIEQIIALAVLMPIVSAIGGNAGTQSLTVTVRALATRELNRSNSVRTFWREIAVGLANGLVLSPLIGVAAALWSGDWRIGAVIATAMVLNLIVAATVGVLTPLTLSRLKFDPAVSSAVFVTATTDFFGFLIFLGLATVVLL
ncbi:MULTISPECIES: magnesium transporter [unclassified Brevundimonas]|jgi:magnesium transporter|uniref:magnesium transporter n=1 Tax=unclassified Brevundimonas TaxID=2622653 RepID=UPI000C5DDDFB|nr:MULTISPECIES: magnesium transporter [unclassified Brevundimonas]MAL87732.1 magnesium transporter [Brevundimonas sp.]|tara:strand:+ start:8575 stop:9981 length:1407 start_codon:yes stop_codon:yes gene_type:complete